MIIFFCSLYRSNKYGNYYIFGQYGKIDKKFQGWAEIYTVDVLKNYKYTNSENRSISIIEDNTTSTGTYFINFVDENGNVKKRNFNKMTCSKKAGVLESELLNILEEYGQSINENEKRQVLINILEELSK